MFATKQKVRNAFPKHTNNSFCSMNHLKKAEIGKTIEVIGDRAFYNCPQLGGVTLPETVRIIHEEAFGSCASITSMVIPSPFTRAFSAVLCPLTRIGNSASVVSGVLYE